MSMNPDLAAAIAFATAHESPTHRDLAHPDGGIFKHDPPPWNRPLGPVASRGPVSGVIQRDGEVLASWGEPDRADFTFSVAKTYLAMLAGVAFDRGLLPDVDEPVGARMRGIGFDHGRNRAVTWAHLLQQTSEWEGESFGIPDQVDRYRTPSFLPARAAGRKGDPRPLLTPGTYWEYNDVRINQLSFALLHLFRRPLPEVFRAAIAQPLGLSADWRWIGYDHAWVDIDGERVPSVPGGTHWGAGVAISARDQARIGQLLLDEGHWAGRTVLARAWIERMRTPCTVAPFYGYLVWLNGAGLYPSASRASWFAIGNGGNITWIDPVQRAVIVARWIDMSHLNEFCGLVDRALRR
jgi:CubicO group peptidase (beta-lactamase class C family)